MLASQYSFKIYSCLLWNICSCLCLRGWFAQWNMQVMFIKVGVIVSSCLSPHFWSGIVWHTYICLVLSLSLSLSLCLTMQTVWFSGVSMFCHLLLETFKEEGFFCLRWCIMFHLLCQDKTEIFSLVHTNIVGVRYDSKGLAMNLCGTGMFWQFAWCYILTISSVHFVQIGDANSQQKIESSSYSADPGHANTEKNSLVSGGKQ